MMKDNRQKGFTLIELMVAMVISGMLVAAVSMAFTGQSRSNNAVNETTILQQDLRSSLQLMAKEIRMAGYNPTGKAVTGISIATATNLQFKLDLNGDGDSNDGNETIRYAPTSSGLGRVTGTGVILLSVVENISNLAYEYYLDDQTWTQAPTDLTKIRAIKIIILGFSARETASSSDTSSFIPPLASVSPLPDWTPATPGNFHWRMMSLIVQCRNLQIKA